MMNEQEINSLAEMFDTIVSSTNPAIQRSFQHTMVLATLAEEKKSGFGPFSTMLKDLTWMREQMQELKREIQILQNQSSNEDTFNVTWDDDNMAAVGGLSTQQITALTTTTYNTLNVSTPLPVISVGNISIDNYNHNYGGDYISIDKC